MARRIDLPTLGGVACAALALALLAPVSWRVQAEEPQKPAAGLAGDVATAPLSTDWLGHASAPALPLPVEGPACRPDAGPDPRTAATLAEVRSRLGAEHAAGPPAGAGDFVVLNGRGYNYGPAEAIDPGLLEFEARKLAR
jgi:hypothetical protein